MTHDEIQDMRKKLQEVAAFDENAISLNEAKVGSQETIAYFKTIKLGSGPVVTGSGVTLEPDEYLALNNKVAKRERNGQILIYGYSPIENEREEIWLSVAEIKALAKWV